MSATRVAAQSGIIPCEMPMQQGVWPQLRSISFECMGDSPISFPMRRFWRLFLLVLGIALLSSCETSGSRSGVATRRLTYSRVVNGTPATSPLHAYCNAYWRAVGKEQLHQDFEFKQTQRSSWLVLPDRAGFVTGTIEIDYSISKAGIMNIEGIRAPEDLQKLQVSLARTAMQKAASSLKPFPESLSFLAGEAIHDTMVFEYR